MIDIRSLKVEKPKGKGVGRYRRKSGAPALCNWSKLTGFNALNL